MKKSGGWDGRKYIYLVVVVVVVPEVGGSDSDNFWVVVFLQDFSQ